MSQATDYAGVEEAAGFQPRGVSREVKAGHTVRQYYAEVCDAIGSATVKVVPFPISLSTLILPS